MQLIELDSEQDKQTISKLIKVEAEMRKELANQVEDNDRFEIE